MGFRPPPQGFRSFWLRLCLGLPTPEGRVRPETYAPRASLGKPHRNAMTAPPEAGCGQQWVAPTIFSGPLSLQGPLVAPVIVEAATRRSAICDGRRGAWDARVESCLPTI